MKPGHLDSGLKPGLLLFWHFYLKMQCCLLLATKLLVVWNLNSQQGRFQQGEFLRLPVSSILLCSSLLSSSPHLSGMCELCLKLSPPMLTSVALFHAENVSKLFDFYWPCWRGGFFMRENHQFFLGWLSLFPLAGCRSFLFCLTYPCLHF